MSQEPGNLNLEKDKVEIIKWVASLRDHRVIDILKMIRDNPKKIDWWNGISDDERKAIELRSLRLEE